MDKTTIICTSESTDRIRVIITKEIDGSLILRPQRVVGLKSYNRLAKICKEMQMKFLPVYGGGIGWKAIS